MEVVDDEGAIRFGKSDAIPQFACPPFEDPDSSQIDPVRGSRPFLH